MSKNKSKSENSDVKTPEYDDDAPLLVKESAVVDVHHRPAADDPTVPACSVGNRNGLEWEPLGEGRDTRMCYHCEGTSGWRNCAGNGCHPRRKLLEADPEDYGLDPMPEPDASNTNNITEER